MNISSSTLPKMTLLDGRYDTMPKADHFDLKENMLVLLMLELNTNINEVLGTIQDYSTREYLNATQ